MFPPTSELSPAGQMYEQDYNRAWELWRASRCEEAYIICRKLLANPLVGKWHQAGFHLLLGHSDDLYVEHAKLARDLYKTMYDESKTPPTTREIATQEKYLKMAEEVLVAARKHPTHEEEDEGGEDKDEDNTVDSGDELVVEITGRVDLVVDSDEWESVSDDDEDVGYTGRAYMPDEWESVSGDEVNDELGDVEEGDISRKKAAEKQVEETKTIM